MYVRLACLAPVAALALVAAGSGGETALEVRVRGEDIGDLRRLHEARVEGARTGTRQSVVSKGNARALAKFPRLLEHVTTLFGRQLDDLRRVRPPTESRQRYALVLRLYAQTDSPFGRAARAARKGDKVGVAAAEAELSALGTNADALGSKCE